MQRLTDIFARDLRYIMNEYRDFTRQTVVQCGTIKHTVMASLQSDDAEFSADATPINAYFLELYFIETGDELFNRALVKNAIIYVDGTAFRVIDSTLVYDLRVMSLERKGGR